mgnify:CR=1 FL=1
MRGLRLLLEQPSCAAESLSSAAPARSSWNDQSAPITISTAEGGFVLVLEDLIVHRDYRHQGLGTRLLDYAVDFARRRTSCALRS